MTLTMHRDPSLQVGQFHKSIFVEFNLLRWYVCDDEMTVAKTPLNIRNRQLAISIVSNDFDG